MSDTSLKRDFARYPGAMSEEDYYAIRIECGCNSCDCDALSQNSYREGCHTYGLFDQEDDATNITESGGLYDESVGFKKQTKNREGLEEEIDFFSLVVKSGNQW